MFAFNFSPQNALCILRPHKGVECICFWITRQVFVAGSLIVCCCCYWIATVLGTLPPATNLSLSKNTSFLVYLLASLKLWTISSWADKSHRSQPPAIKVIWLHFESAVISSILQSMVPTCNSHFLKSQKCDGCKMDGNMWWQTLRTTDSQWIYLEKELSTTFQLSSFRDRRRSNRRKRHWLHQHSAGCK